MSERLKKALLIFARQPLPGKVKTRLVPPLLAEQAADLYACMLCDVIAKAAHIPDVENFLFYEETNEARQYFAALAAGMICISQRGKDLGERMAEAFNVVFARGHRAAAIIGTDAPDLPLHFIEAAFNRLENRECEVVFGPCEDGGYYLLGMKRLYRSLFHDVPWSSNVVLEMSLKRAEEAGIAVSLLPVWHDVDTEVDLNRPELLDEGNGAPLTRDFLLNRLRVR